MKKRGLAPFVTNLIIGILVVLMIGVATRPLWAAPREAQIKATLNNLINTLNKLEPGKPAARIPVLVPTGWWLKSFSKDEISPCWSKDCVCICSKKTKCDDEFCRTLTKSLVYRADKRSVEEEIPIDIWLASNGYFEIVATRGLPKDYEGYELSDIWLDDFFKKQNSPLAGLGQCMVDASEESGVPIQIIVGVAAHESDWGRSGLAGAYTYNLFSYKGIGPAGSSKWISWECLKEKKEGLTCVEDPRCEEKWYCRGPMDFRAYHDQCESVKDFAERISTEKIYEAAMRADNLQQIVYLMHGCPGGVGKCIYATDPNWSAGVLAVIGKLEAELAS